MKLTKEAFENITRGISSVQYEAGRYQFFRFDERETATVDSQIASCTAGVKMDFVTDGNALRLQVFTEKALPARSFFAFDVFINGTLAGHIKNFDEQLCTGDYANLDYPLGRFSGEFTLGEGEKRVTVFFPHSVRAYIEEAEVAGATYVLPVKQEKTLLAYGDSITQGFDALYPSHSYAVRLSKFLDAELLNKGIGGACFCPSLVMAGAGYQPDYIVVAYGTNDWTCHTQESFKSNAQAHIQELTKKYPASKIFVITPIWRGDYANERKFGPFSKLEAIIREECEESRQIHIISGWNLVPEDASFFGDLFLHPNDKGFAAYAEALHSALKAYI